MDEGEDKTRLAVGKVFNSEYFPEAYQYQPKGSYDIICGEDSQGN